MYTYISRYQYTIYDTIYSKPLTLAPSSRPLYHRGIDRGGVESPFGGAKRFIPRLEPGLISEGDAGERGQLIGHGLLL